MKLVLVESPYAGDIEANLTYLRSAMRDCFSRGEAPFASHALYTQPGVLDDSIPADRKQGIEAGLLWGAKAEASVFYVDRGFSKGMRQGLERAKAEGRPCVFRLLVGVETISETDAMCYVEALSFKGV